MDILALAQKMELEGKAYYEKLADETPISELRGVFNFLAKEEQNHYDLFTSLAGQDDLPEVSDGRELQAKVKEIFGQLTASFSLPVVVYDYQAAYEKALAMERSSVSYYTDALAKVGADQKKTVEFIIGQEQMHAKLLESLIEFVNGPKTWIENSEWHHLDAY